MALPMARPVKIKASPNLRFRQRIPKDVLSKAHGQIIALPVGDETVRVPISRRAVEVIVSLRTSDHRVGRTRHRAVADHLSHWFAPCEPASRP